MKRFASPRLAVALLLVAAFAVGSFVSAQRSTATAMAVAANMFLDSLSPAQRQQATFPFEGDERLRWNFIPSEAFPRNGLMLNDMTEEQRRLAHDLLRTGLSQRGYLTYTEIIQLEEVLRAIEGGGRFVRDPGHYRFSVFGTPASGGAWGWRVEGHHISLHFTIADGTAVASTPSFAGSNPAEVREGARKGQRVLALLEDTGRAVVTALDASQRTTAVINPTAPNEIVTSNTLDIDPLSPDGLKASAMTPAQRDLLMRVIDAYAGLMAPDIAAARLARIKEAGLDNVAFAWAGPIARGQRHYYRVQGPTFLVEFDNSQNDGNHVHSVWRDFNGDFGRDLLREHLRSARH
jgi:hypothetical protein